MEFTTMERRGKTADIYQNPIEAAIPSHLYSAKGKLSKKDKGECTSRQGGGVYCTCTRTAAPEAPDQTIFRLSR
jgi:hypothetical protein